MRVLICDDNPDAADTLGALLTIERHETFTCYDGAACVVKARTWRPQIVLLDIGMPGMNGYDVARAIRALPFGKEVFLVAVTGYGSEADKLLATEAGFDLHLVKPPEAARLLKAIESRARASSG